MKKLFYLSLLFIIASCGGGGGGSNSSPTMPDQTSTPTPTPTPTPSNSPSSGAIEGSGDFETDKLTYENTPEYSQQPGLALINASSAYARGATGQGALIGIMDSGVDDNHQELDGTNKLTSDSYLVYQNRSPTTEEKRHGTHVSAIALGERDNSGMHGVAFDAQLFFISIELGTAGEDYEPAQIDSTVDYTGIDNSWSTLESYFVERGVTVVNGSFGYQGNINDYTEENIRGAFPKTIEVIAQSDKSEADKTLFIWAAGNGGGYADQGVDYSSPEVFGGLPHLISELRTHSAAVVSVDQDGKISSFSNRCGVAKDYCIAAPGRSITSAYAQDPPDTAYYAEYSGTSMATPHVSGGIALLSDYFQGQLGNAEILQRIFATANKSGIYADSDIYGQGLMDLDAATMPLGTTMIATIGKTLNGLSFEEEGTSFSFLGPAVGDSISRVLNIDFVVFDSLGAPFKRSLGKKVLTDMPSLAWLSSSQSNPSKRITEIESHLGQKGRLTLGLSRLNHGEHNFTKSLWPDNDKNLNYFSVIHSISDKSYYFLGNGSSPANYFGINKNRQINNFQNSRIYSSPFLEFSSKGSFLGGGMNIDNNRSFSAAYFKGHHPDKEKYINYQEKSQGLMVEYTSASNNSLISYQGGYLIENKGFLGAAMRGGFGSLNQSETLFTGIQFANGYNNIFTKGSFYLGKTSPEINSLGLVSGLNDFLSSSFSFGIFTRGIFSKKDSIGLQVSQPLKLERGSMLLSLPKARTRYKDIIFESYNLDLETSGRQVNSEILYENRSNNLSFFGRIGWVKDESHIHRDAIEPYLMFDFELRLLE